MRVVESAEMLTVQQKIQQQLEEIYKKERRLKEEEARQIFSLISSKTASDQNLGCDLECVLQFNINLTQFPILALANKTG